MILYLIRHGQARYDGSDITLTELGQTQARLLGERMAKARIDRVFVSGKTRAVQTLAPLRELRPELPVETDPDLREVSRMILGGHDVEGHTPERVEADRERADRMYRRYVDPAKGSGHVALFCHGNLTRYFVARTLGVPTERIWRLISIHCASISVIRVETDLLRVYGVNSIDHLGMESVNESYQLEFDHSPYPPGID